MDSYRTYRSDTRTKLLLLYDVEQLMDEAYLFTQMVVLQAVTRLEMEQVKCIQLLTHAN